MEEARIIHQVFLFLGLPGPVRGVAFILMLLRVSGGLELYLVLTLLFLGPFGIGGSLLGLSLGLHFLEGAAIQEAKNGQKDDWNDKI